MGKYFNKNKKGKKERKSSEDEEIKEDDKYTKDEKQKEANEVRPIRHQKSKTIDKKDGENIKKEINIENIKTTSINQSLEKKNKTIRNRNITPDEFKENKTEINYNQINTIKISLKSYL